MQQEPLTADQRKQLIEESRKHLDYLQRVLAAYGRMVDAADPFEREPTDPFLILTAAAGRLTVAHMQTLADILDCCSSVKEECRLEHKEPEDYSPAFRAMFRGVL